MVRSWKWEIWHGRLQLCVYTTKKILPRIISCSGINQSLEILCTANTGVDLFILPHLHLFPRQYKQQLWLAQMATERSRFLSRKKKPISSIGFFKKKKNVIDNVAANSFMTRCHWEDLTEKILSHREILWHLAQPSLIFPWWSRGHVENIQWPCL